MTVHVATALGQRRRTTSSRRVKGLSANRAGYDERRRARIDPHARVSLKAYATLVRRDPCSYCMDFCGQMAADHIDGLNAGGANRWDNLTAAGRPCNAAKKDKPLLLFLLERA